MWGTHVRHTRGSTTIGECSPDSRGVTKTASESKPKYSTAGPTWPEVGPYSGHYPSLCTSCTHLTSSTGSRTKPNAELKEAQAAVNHMQWIIESAMICLLEQRLKYPIKKIGILEAFIPQRKIEVLSGVTTIGKFIISGLEYLKIHRLPSPSQERLLGRCKFLKFNNEGMLSNFTDLTELSIQTQEEKLENYRLAIQRTVADFLAHFAGSETFYQRPEVTVKQGVHPSALQEAMSSCGAQIEGFHAPGWGILEVLEKLQEQQYQDVAETAMAEFKKLKRPMEIRAAVLKACRLHVKDLIGSIAHLTSVFLPIQHPSEEDLENWIGWNPAVMDAMKEMEESQKEDRVEIQKHLDKMDKTLMTIIKTMRSIRVSQELRDEKENQLLAGFKDFKSKSDNK